MINLKKKDKRIRACYGLRFPKVGANNARTR